MDPGFVGGISSREDSLAVSSHRPVVRGPRVPRHRLRVGSLLLLTLAVWASPSAAQVPTETADSAKALYNQGLRAYRLGSQQSLERAIGLWTQAAALYREVGDRAAAGTTLNNIGEVHRALGRPDSALAYLGQALVIRRALGDRPGEGGALNNIGLVHDALGRPDSALAYYGQALVIRREVGDRRGEGATLSNIGLVYDALGRPDSALAYYGQALVIRRAVGDRGGEGATLSNIGLVYDALGRPDSALAYYGQALVIRRAVGDRRGEGVTLNGMGGVHSALGRPDSALAYFGQALVIARAVGDRPGEGTTLNNIGLVHRALGRPDSALAYYGQALVIVRAVGDRPGEGTTLNNIGLVHRALGRPDSALAYYGQALVIRRAVGDRAGEGTTLNNIGVVHRALGRPDSALAYLGQALVIRREVGDRRGEGTTLNNIGAVHRALGRPDSALAYYGQALAIQRAMGDRRGAGTTLNNMGGVHSVLGRPDSALAYLGQALVIVREVGDRAGEGTTLNNIGEVHRALGRPDSALAYLGQALVIRREVGDRRGEGTTLTNIGVFYHRAADSARLGAAVAYYDSAAAALASIAAHAGTDPNRLTFAAQSVPLFNEWSLAWLGLEGRAGARAAAFSALAVVERGRAQALLDLMRTSADTIVAGKDLAAEGLAVVHTVTQRGVAALSYLVTADTLIIWLVWPSGELDVTRRAVARDSVNQLVGQWRRALGVDQPAGRSGSRAAATAQRLVALLLPSVLTAGSTAFRELVIVPHGPLGLVPFAALPLEHGELLGLQYALRYAPSLAVLAETEARPGLEAGVDRRTALREALVVGNPKIPAFVQAEPLPEAEREAAWLAGELRVRWLGGRDATESAVRQRLPSARLVHLATHGRAFASDAQVRRSFLMLATDEDTGTHDGILSLADILDSPRLELLAELVVLSACQTGLGNLQDAEGMVGFARALLARSALVSLWRVDDRATRELMERFYTHWLGPDQPSKTEALRRAQQELQTERRFADPRAWAAFQLVGAR